jgi:hypothetical protein
MHSPKTVLLHKGNILPSIPVAYAVHRKETYETMKEILNFVKYKIKQRHICGDFKATAIFIGLQKFTQNSVVSYTNEIVMTKVFTTSRTGLYVNHIHLERRT